MEEMWFQQDGATAQTARASMTVVRQMFPQHVVSRFGDVPWPPRSPDLSACNFFLWGYLKSKVYVRKPRTVDDLKVSIPKETATVPQEMLVNVMHNFDVWLTVHRSSMWIKRPTRCHLVLYLFLLYRLLNMFRATLCPSSGADDLVVFFRCVAEQTGIQMCLQHKAAYLILGH